MSNSELKNLLRRITDVLEKIQPKQPKEPNFKKATAFVWLADERSLNPIEKVNRVPIKLLKGIDPSRDTLLQNTERFARGFPANNALLWGARGTGKSSLIKAAHQTVNLKNKELILIEIHREDIRSLSQLLPILRDSLKYRFIVFCDDLSFDRSDDSYKSLKALLEGGIEGRPDNVLFYATSNRRHLMPRDMMENETSTAINPSETVEEKVSLSDRFGLWLGFYNFNQETYFDIIDCYAKEFDLNIDQKELHSRALEWSLTRGARSGRVAWQFIQDLAGRLEKHIH